MLIENPATRLTLHLGELVPSVLLIRHCHPGKVLELPRAVFLARVSPWVRSADSPGVTRDSDPLARLLVHAVEGKPIY